MRKHIAPYLLCLFFLMSCKKDKDPLSQLPPETQTGANTFGCLVNGKAWVPKGTDYGSGTNVVAKYEYAYPSPTGYTLIITAHDYEGDGRQGFNIGMDSMRMTTGSTFRMTNKKGMGGATYFIQDETQNYVRYLVNDSIYGEMKIILLDESKQIVSGTFWFDAINSLGDRVSIREGRFDVKYTR